jgi:predicted kinase
MGKPVLIIMLVGLPGSGKSTFARRLAPRIGAVVLESDVNRRLLFGTPSHSAAESRALFRTIHAAARTLLERGYPVIIDATNLKESARRPVIALADSLGIRLFIVQLEAPDPVVRERLVHRGALPDGHLAAGVEVYEQMAETSQPLLHDHWRIDTSDPEAYEQALDALSEACGEPVLSRGRDS